MDPEDGIFRSESVCRRPAFPLHALAFFDFDAQKADCDPNAKCIQQEHCPAGQGQVPVREQRVDAEKCNARENEQGNQ